MTEYDIPETAFGKARSDAFMQFYQNWFEEPIGLLRREVDTGFLNDLTPRERELAIDLLRRNLHLGHTQIIEGIALFDDKESIPNLKTMLAEATNASRRLTIAGSLWKLNKDESFPEEIDRLVKTGVATLKEAHFEQILWLDDERTILYLIDLLDEGDSFASYLALARLNEFEDNKRYLLGRDEFPHQPDYFRNRREDGSFVRTMVAKIGSYSPVTAVTTTTNGIVSKEMRVDDQ